MPKHIWSILCKQGEIDEQTQSITISNVMEHISVEATTAPGFDDLTQVNLPLEMDILSYFTGTPGEKWEQRIEYLSPTGDVLSEYHQNLELSGEAKRLRSKVHLDGIGAKGSGEYLFRVSIRQGDERTYQVVAEIPLEIDLTLTKKTD